MTKYNIKIPKKIHQIWMGEGKKPTYIKKFMDSWKKNFPEWEYILWDDDKIEKTDFKVKKYFHHFENYTFKCDMLRFEVLYRYGGIYADTDFECIRNFEHLLDNLDFLAAKDKEDLVIHNAIMGCIPNHEFIKKICSDIPGRVENVLEKNSGAHTAFGPGFMVSEFIKYKPKIKVFPSDLFYPYYYTDTAKYQNLDMDFKKIFPKAYAIHHWAASWRGKDNKQFRDPRFYDYHSGDAI